MSTEHNPFAALLAGVTRFNIKTGDHTDPSVLMLETEVLAALAAMTKERDKAMEWAKEQHACADDYAKRLAAERAKVARLVEAGKRVLAPLDEPCRHDHHGYCQAHFIEADCSVAALRAAITEAGQ